MKKKRKLKQPAAVQPPATKALFLENLDSNYSEVDVRILCEIFGQVKYLHLNRDCNGQFLGNCIVEYRSNPDFRAALANINGLSLRGKVVKARRCAAADEIAGVSSEWIQSTLSLDVENEFGGGFCDDPGNLDDPDDLGSGLIYCKQIIHCSESFIRCKNKLLLGSVPLSFNALLLQRIFASFGNVSSCYVKESITMEKPKTVAESKTMDSNLRSEKSCIKHETLEMRKRQFGVVEFGTSQEAELAIETLNGMLLTERMHHAVSG
eukprot:Gregarina_sp_Poly_1__4506@NODE_2420_length_2153_cov_112_611218_g1539_i0_p1_GENE_NODE_2420_length_2153_cov_112_611218_g1539_i0NODE_2420_length_2153_cov_112_611218_g1539_i0_p1_ORF_typecomplete_len265_score47_74RRM_1/PF00076_22/4_1e09RRM_1/PF00076_22/2_6e07RRM_5/PF13893_6/0_0046RRM_5/PF13893_6/1_9e03RRM_5/PF13893_6/0_45RRM_7/PF16367_5/0_03RRM_occluded/PF16842_5/0_59RRM_occluded/PF16842_5/7_4e02RRM_3/PF08777_11/2RRM_3/PF08777_11/8_1e03RRM_3/PF08777_11/4_8e02_NODE_2420_length_2153_cov_112_611218_g153